MWGWQGTHYIVFVFVVLVVSSVDAMWLLRLSVGLAGYIHATLFFVFVLLVVLLVGAVWLLSVVLAGYKLHCFCICFTSCFVSWCCMAYQCGVGRVQTILFLYLLC